MWFTREQFEICNELRMWGLEPRFEPGDVVARGFADLGFEEFQVLPGERLLSLTAGTTTALPADHRGHFFWIPSTDECVDLLEKLGVPCVSCQRLNGREWSVQSQCHGDIEVQTSVNLHTAFLKTLLLGHRRVFKGAKP